MTNEKWQSLKDLDAFENVWHTVKCCYNSNMAKKKKLLIRERTVPLNFPCEGGCKCKKLLKAYVCVEAHDHFSTLDTSWGCVN